MPSVGIIVLTWNNYYDTCECLQSLSNINYPSYKTIVVDNNSTDGSIRKLQSQFRECEYLLNESNYGYAEGNNLGIKLALDMGVDCIWILNNDVVTERNALLEMVKVAESDSTIGIVGSKVYRYNSPNTLSSAGGLINRWTGATKHLGQGETDAGQFDTFKEVDYITGCNFLIKTSCIRDIGFINKDYFLYYEDTDWSARARKNGWRVVYAPVPGVWHKISASLQEPSLAISYYNSRNRLYFVRNNFAAHWPVALLVSPRYCIINHIAKRRWRHLWICLKAYRDFFLNRMGEYESNDGE